MQKPEITYEGAEYDYPYTPKDFPFFYDKAYWTKYLDQLTEQRINTLYLWSGHPFTSLLKLPKYRKRRSCRRRSWSRISRCSAGSPRRPISAAFGCCRVSTTLSLLDFAKAPAPVPLHPVGAYSRQRVEVYKVLHLGVYSRAYPNVGIFMTLAKAMGPKYGADWAKQNPVVPGVLDGLVQLDKKAGHPITPPPIVIRAHATNIEDVIPGSEATLYPNFDKMWKWNGESLTWTNIRGPVKARFDQLIAGRITRSSTYICFRTLSRFVGAIRILFDRRC